MTRNFLETARSGSYRGEILNRDFGGLKDQIKLRGGDFVTGIGHAPKRRHQTDPQSIRSTSSRQRNPESAKANPGIGVHRSLDGTTNYVTGALLFGVHRRGPDGEMTVGSFSIPRTRRCSGRSRTEVPISRSQIRVSRKESWVTDFSHPDSWRSKQYLEMYLDSFRVLFSESAGVRRMRSRSHRPVLYCNADGSTDSGR